MNNIQPSSLNRVCLFCFLCIYLITSERNTCFAAVVSPGGNSQRVPQHSSNGLTGDSNLNEVQSNVDRQLGDKDFVLRDEGDLSPPVINNVQQHVSREEQFSAGEGKRGSFNSWGGKRSVEDLGGNQEESGLDDVEKRARFASWGGKRAGFNSWGGKRSDEVLDMDKKAKFSSWGGKRNVNVRDLKRKFNAWGGKRSGDDSWDPRKRAKFSSWGGKRADDMISDMDMDMEKRAKFNSWGGKRAQDSDIDEDKRAQFNSWGGKRSQLEEFLEKRAKFNSWGGKRSDENVKRKFNAWGGKRNAEYNLGKYSSFTCCLLHSR